MGEGLLFLPDISGFTNFINRTSSEHSKHIIAELLEILIDQNELGLELAEIEGDALFFYKEGPLPSRQEILAQAHKMYTAFHSHLLLYDNLRICSCGACKSAADLKLKFIVHAGPLDYIEVRGFKKPHGKDVIVAHRLMKNSVPGDEYILLSNAVHGHENQVEDFLPFQQLTDTYDSGKVDYSYSDISVWQADVTMTNTTPPLPGASPRPTTRKPSVTLPRSKPCATSGGMACGSRPSLRSVRRVAGASTGGLDPPVLTAPT